VAAEFLPERANRQLAGLQPGTVIGGYRLDGRIGAGGMAIVFRARDETLDRSVALKVLAPVLTEDAEFRERFIRESRAASVVDHPNIIPIYGAGEDAGVLYLAMRYVSGGDLHSVVEREGALPAERAIALLSPVASALDAAHRAGIVHRDVKPANVLVDVSPGRPDHPYLSDFGLAKTESAATLTNAGEFVGTTGFAAPEQIDGRPPRFASDQYALACVAFTLLAARMPFRHRHPEAVLWAQMSQPPPRVTAMRPDLPAAADEVLARALAKNPLDRFPTCADFVNALDLALAGQAARPYVSPAPYISPAPFPPAPTGAQHGHPSFPAPGQAEAPGRRDKPPWWSLEGSTPPGDLPPSAGPPPEPEPASRPLRARGPRIAAAAGMVVVVAAVAGVTLLHKLHAGDEAAAGNPGSTRASAARLEVAVNLAATLHDPQGQSIVSAAFGPGGVLRADDATATAYTYAVASRHVTGSADLSVLGWEGGLFSLDGAAFAAPGGGCLPGGTGPCSYQVFSYDAGQWTSQIKAGRDSPDAMGDFTMAVTSESGDGVQVWNLRTLMPVATVTDPDHRPLGILALSPDGSTVAAVSAGTGNKHEAHVWKTASPAEPTSVLSVPGNLSTRAYQVGGSGTPLLVAGSTLAVSDGLTTNVYHPGSRSPATSLPGDLLALSPDGKLVATTDQQNPAAVDLRNAATGQTAATLAGPGERTPATSVVFSSDGRSLAVSYNDGATYVWRLTES
jgi:serine/threonine protein kinase